MKTLYQNVLSGFSFGLTAGLTILLTLSLAGVIYAQVNNIWTNPTELEAVTGNSLTSDSWNKILSNQKYLSETMAGLGEAPQNSVMAFASTSCPSGWKAADGTNGTPDLRGVFIRGANNFGTGNNNRDQDRATAGSGVLTYQEDAIRNITGTLFQQGNRAGINSANGVFYGEGGTNYAAAEAPASNVPVYVHFNASRVVPVGLDNRPKNVALIYCVKN